jgi:hypothetical protein
MVSIGTQYETDGNRNVRIKRLESVINTVFHRNYKEDLLNGSKTMKMTSQNWFYLNRRLGMMMNQEASVCTEYAKHGLVDTVFEELVSDKSFIETCNFLRSHAIRIDQQYKEKAARKIHLSMISSPSVLSHDTKI